MQPDNSVKKRAAGPRYLLELTYRPTYSVFKYTNLCRPIFISAIARKLKSFVTHCSYYSIANISVGTYLHKKGFSWACCWLYLPGECWGASFCNRLFNQLPSILAIYPSRPTKKFAYFTPQYSSSSKGISTFWLCTFKPNFLASVWVLTSESLFSST